jgi:ABC-type transport system substrate-binding protein
MRQLALFLILAVVGSVAIACGGGDDDATATATSPSGQQPTSPSGTVQPTSTTSVSQPAPQPQNPAGTISVAVFDIGPGVGVGSAQAPVESMQNWGVGEGLFAVDGDGNITNKLASDWTLAQDLSMITITTREGVRFHSKEGQDFGNFSADDVVYTLNDANANTNATSIHGQAGDFAALFGEATKIDDRTVQIPFETFDLRWQGNFLNEQAQGTAYFSKNALDTMGRDWLLDNIISTGPFEVVEWVQDDRAVIQKVDYDHWFKNAEVQTIRFVEVPEPSTRVAQLRAGQIDIATQVPLKDIGLLRDDGFIAEQITRKGTIHQIIFSGNYWEKLHARTGEPLDVAGRFANDLPWQGNPDDPDDMEEARQVRWAFAKAIDRELLIDTLLEGFGDVASIEYADTTASYFQDRWLIPYDTAAARQHMQNTAWPEGKFTMNIWTGGELGGSSGTNAEINDAVAGMWLELWPEMDIQVFKSAYAIIRPGLVGRTNTIPYAGDCDEGSTTIPFDWNHGLTETSFTRGGFGCGIEIPKIAETFTAVSTEPDIARRIELNNELIDYLYDQMIFAGTVQVPNLTIYNPNSISSWEGTPSLFTDANEYEFIVPAR